MRFAAGIAGLCLALATGGAQAQLACGGGVCSEIQYGLGSDPNFRNEDDPNDPFKYDHADFGSNTAGISYYYNRGDLNFALNCGPERIFNPLPGQVTLNEITACTPTSEGPKCVAGANAGLSCHLNANEPFASRECPGSTCQDTAGGCRVEIPITDGGKTNPASTSEYWITTLNATPGGVFQLTALTGNTFGGTSAAKECSGTSPTPRQACNSDAECGGAVGSCVSCYPPFIRQKPSMGTRYLLPDARRNALGLPAGATYVRWDKGIPAGAPGTPPEQDPRIANATAFRLHQDDAAVCCNSSIPGLCSSANLPFSNYPLLWRPTCTAPTGVQSLINEDNILPDWIFVGGRNSRFFTDPNYELPGEQYGVCLNNRDIGCSRGGTQCDGLGDVCDFRERGIRIQVAATSIRNAAGDPVTSACGSALAVLRGAPETGCTQEPRYPVDGDPGRDCRVFNYGVNARVDSNCDGTVDSPVDKCPFFSEWNALADTDADCAISPARCRGDECECGDATRDGNVNVSDIVEANLMIFGARIRQLLSDANSDLQTNVSDLVSVNQELFVPDSSTCRHITSIRCGNTAVDPGEVCDNGARCTTIGTCSGGPTPGAGCTVGGSSCGAGGTCVGTLCDASGVNTCGTGTCERIGGDGCNPACRTEFGWTCVNPPGGGLSTCTRN